MPSTGQGLRVRITFHDATSQEFEVDVQFATFHEFIHRIATGQIKWLPVKYSGVINLDHAVMVRVLPQKTEKPD